MPNMHWSDLSHLQLGQYGEYYAKMEFASYGYDIYTSEVDDHGIDFVARKSGTGEFFEIQVKSMFKGKYVFIQKNKLVMDEYHLVCFLHFEEGKLPDIYVIPSLAWLNPTAILVDRNYDKEGQKSKPEWGINYSNKNKALLDSYKADFYFQKNR